MPQDAKFDQSEAHKFYSAQCFNQAWGLIDKSDRTAEDNARMLLLSQASLWHWTQRDDCTPTNLSIGYWQTSRIYALLDQAENAKRYGKLCLEHSPEDEPFYVGYAYEALARAAAVGGDIDKMEEYLGVARKAVENVTDADSRKMLLDDLGRIG